MGRGTGAKSWQQRERIVQTAARIMAEEGVKDYFSAKQKAADRLGVARNSPNLPRNAEIEAALAAYQRLFRADTQPAQLRRMREIACEAMRFFRPFHPRLVGPVLSGVADGHSEITLHLFAESLEQVALHLDDAGIPHHLEERRFRMGTRERPFPLLRFLVDGTPIAAVVFDMAAIRQAPVSQATGRPMERASLARVQDLLGAAV
ncbi:MAG TPA: hypothetical protein PKE41_06960 [Candidatus Macondimonas sp.]|nr:hypothetical protein [Candidatus Macondimonas sp.]